MRKKNVNQRDCSHAVSDNHLHKLILLRHRNGPIRKRVGSDSMECSRLEGSVVDEIRLYQIHTHTSTGKQTAYRNTKTSLVQLKLELVLRSGSLYSSARSFCFLL